MPQDKHLVTHLSTVTAEVSPLEEETSSAAWVTASESLASPSLCDKHPWEKGKRKDRKSQPPTHIHTHTKIYNKDKCGQEKELSGGGRLKEQTECSSQGAQLTCSVGFTEGSWIPALGTLERSRRIPCKIIMRSLKKAPGFSLGEFHYLQTNL